VYRMRALIELNFVARVLTTCSSDSQVEEQAVDGHNYFFCKITCSKFHRIYMRSRVRQRSRDRRDRGVQPTFVAVLVNATVSTGFVSHASGLHGRLQPVDMRIWPLVDQKPLQHQTRLVSMRPLSNFTGPRRLGTF
jgi:hypothetical protein